MLVWTSTLDLQWNDLPLKSVFLPFVHRVVALPRRLHREPAVADRRRRARAGRAGRRPGSDVTRVVLTPSGERVTLDGDGPDVLELAEQGFYEVRAQGRDASRRSSWPATSIWPNRI